MARQKTPSPQEIYRARKAREDRERAALLPPGLVNHGNTCFMNSVLQGLIATRYLQLLVHARTVTLPSQPPIASCRSPALANRHARAREHGQPWSNALAISDQLISLLQSAWDIQNNRRRENMSPKDLLSALGKKYDQYLDFRQQDAHEFLCQLLDAIRMEEVDIIKQRSPSQKNTGKQFQPSRPHRLSTLKPASQADDEPLSFIDMLFGGKLASILVCQTCKHVSHTYEDFSDLSLSMKPEDYVRERKRDKLKQLAKRIGTALYVAAPQQRSSSVPTTPARDSHLDSPDTDNPQRRRSIDLADVEVVVKPVDATQDAGAMTKDDPPLQVLPSPVPDSPSIPGTPADTHQPVPVPDHPVPGPPHNSSGDFVAVVAPEKVNGKAKDRDESWAKISRRISASVGLARRPKGERRDKKGNPSVTPLKPVDEGNPPIHLGSTLATVDTTNGATSLERESTSLGLVNERLQAHLTNVKRSVMPTQRSGNSPPASSTPRFPLISRPSSPRTRSKSSKPARTPKLSAEEAAYLRDILADINPPNIQKPFSIFKQSREPSSTSAFYSQNIFLKVNQINKIEECLRLFTSVEVLDGDNTVRCHRCWKIANGFYKPRARRSAQEPDSCSDSEGDEAVDTKNSSDHVVSDPMPANLASSIISRSSSHSTTSLQDTRISRDTPSTLTHTTHNSSTHKPIPPVLQLNGGNSIELVSPIKDETPTQRVMVVPSIPAITSDSPIAMETPKFAPVRGNTVLSTSTQTSVTTERSSRISLSAPSDQHQRHMIRTGDSNTESEVSEGESETLLSVCSDISSIPSTNPSPNASQDHLPRSSSVRGTQSKDPSGVPRSRQYIMRPAYKRYLIATPPPILVVHLKRFQQLSKTPVVSFSTGFKKLDDYISFPEYLDLAPYLAPRREDYFDSKVAVSRGRARRPTPCMYRLYAVVVHIGNMLGGHYVAYTALPSSPSEAEPPRPENEKRRPDGGTATRDWAFISDTIVRLSSLEEVLKSKAYICMYERI